MKKQLKKIQSACARLNDAASIDQAMRNLKLTIRDWFDSGEECVTGLFSDEVSGEIELCHVGDPHEANIPGRNELYQLNDDNGGFVVMTGLEFESIVKRWRSFRKGWK